MKRFFITGTDTEVGKTFISVCLLEKARQLGMHSIGFKPIAAGCEQTSDGLRNSDALALQRAATMKLPYDAVNPYALAEPIAPHIAASKAGIILDPELLSLRLNELTQLPAELLLVEGAGGWSLPLGQGRLLSDWVEREQLPVILVVGMRLGCLNHAILTAQRIQAQGLELAGWIANIADNTADQQFYPENLETLKSMLPGPLLGEVGYAPQTPVAVLAEQLSMP